ncbi:efflux transporter outer membrane subunit [Paraburkholderia sp. J94]|uniref:efflux transporter outer membrane subunit n=1 Tax=Paraburkholderia sp. J94 TaxID=2805441 RepID=UPI002AB1F60C|nr:efflux transporter outer membrane subunit [Paraburkholderia sp. J94]
MLALTTATAAAVLLSACIDSGGIHKKASMLDAASLDPGAALRATQADAQWPRGDWWRQWHDAQLERVVADATAGNPDLQAFAARVDAARFQTEIAGASAWPQANVDGEFERRRYARYTTPAPPGGTTVWSNSIGATLTYDLDLWGKQRAIREGALDRLHASAADARFAEVELQTGVVRAYVQLSLDYALADAYAAIQNQQRRTFDIATQRWHAGIGSRLEAAQAQTQLSTSATRLQRAQQQIALDRLAIAALAGQGPGYGDALARPTLALSVPLALPPALPAELVGHRADVVAARWRVLASEQGIDAAHADFYPDINLLATASLGSAATFGGFFNFVNSDGVGHGVGAAISLPIFDGGRRRGQYGVAVSSRDAAVDAYNRTVIDAMRDVAAQAISLRALDEQQASTEATLDAARTAYRLADEGYRSGISEFLNVLAAQNAQLVQEQSLALVQAQRLDAWAQLMRALGGGYVAEATAANDSPATPTAQGARDAARN